MPRKSNSKYMGSKNVATPARTSTKMERGTACQIREEFWGSKPERQKLNAIVHEKNKEPTKIEMPQKNDSWTKKRSWES